MGFLVDGVHTDQFALERADADFELAAYVVRREQRQERQRRRKGREFTCGLGELLAQPEAGGVAAGFGDFVDRALGKGPVALGFADGDQVAAQQAVDGLVQAVALADVDDLVLTARLDELLHPVGMHRGFGEHREDGERERGVANHEL